MTTFDAAADRNELHDGRLVVVAEVAADALAPPDAA
jgi:hypothetical protein